MGKGRLTYLLVLLLVLGATALAACAPERQSVTIYSSRTRTLVEPVLNAFAEQYDVNVRVRYGSTAEIVATLGEEGKASPADVVYIAEPVGLGALAQQGILDTLPQALLNKVDARLRSPKGEWVGTSGRAKTVAYNTARLKPEDLPRSILDFTDPKWKGRIGWAPRHGEFQELITAMRRVVGDERTKAWLQGIKANNPTEYPNLISTVQGVAHGEVEVGFVNHYYIPRFLDEEGQGFGARNYFLGGGDAGALVTVAGVGITKTTKQRALAEKFVEYMLSKEAQEYFAKQTKEYPLAAGVQPLGDLPSLDSVNPPNIDLGDMTDLQGTLQLMREAGVLN